MNARRLEAIAEQALVHPKYADVMDRLSVTDPEACAVLSRYVHALREECAARRQDVAELRRPTDSRPV